MKKTIFAFALFAIAFFYTAASAGDDGPPRPIIRRPPPPARPQPPRPQPVPPQVRREQAAAGATTTGASEVEKTDLFKKAKEADPERYRFASGLKASFRPTPDKRSFYISWLPENANDGGETPIVVTLHGHGSYAFDEFFLWQPHLAPRGYGIIALQWWFGKGEAASDYYMPNELYKNIDVILSSMRVRPRTVLLHGFSRGSANSYAVTAFDASTKKNYFLATLSNAGGAGKDFPPNVEIEKGRFGGKPFDGTHWIMYAGAKDPNPDRDGVAGMRSAEEWVKRHGGTVDLFIEDKNGDHGGFHRNPENIKKALDAFSALAAGSKGGPRNAK